MITTGDISNILYSDIKSIGVRVIADGSKSVGEVMEEFVIIHTKREIAGERWNSTVVEVNFFVPDISNTDINTIRYDGIERDVRLAMKGHNTGIINGARYRYKIESVGKEYDEELKNSFLNIKLIFETLNVI